MTWKTFDGVLAGACTLQRLLVKTTAFENDRGADGMWSWRWRYIIQYYYIMMVRVRGTWHPDGLDLGYYTGCAQRVTCIVTRRHSRIFPLSGDFEGWQKNWQEFCFFMKDKTIKLCKVYFDSNAQIGSREGSCTWPTMCARLWSSWPNDGRQRFARTAHKEEASTATAGRRRSRAQ